MSKRNDNTGLLICGACAVPADPESNEPTSIDLLAEGIKRFLARSSHRTVAVERKHATASARL